MGQCFSKISDYFSGATHCLTKKTLLVDYGIECSGHSSGHNFQGIVDIWVDMDTDPDLDLDPFLRDFIRRKTITSAILKFQTSIHLQRDKVEKKKKTRHRRLR